MLAELKGLNEECGVFAVSHHPNAADVCYYGLQSLQHRGQEGAGIVTSNGEQLHTHRGQGLVNAVFGKDELESLTGTMGVAHVRYATAGGGGLSNVQPLVFQSHSGGLAVAHNGNLVNAERLKQQLEDEGAIFHSTSDTEVLAHLVRRSRCSTLATKMASVLPLLKGAYSFAVMDEHQLVVARDPHGMRPLSLGRLGEGFIIASETCAFDAIGAEFIRDVKPGELLVIDAEGCHSQRFVTSAQQAICSMEYVYFARPDSDIEAISVHGARKRLGQCLADEAPTDADVVIGVPDSSLSAAMGYAERSGLPYELGLIKNRYIGRTFIQPSQLLREQGVKMKLSAVRSVIKDRRVVIVDDSIVRGTTSMHLVQLLREAGAKEVHMRISAPSIKHPCFYGIDTSAPGELIGAAMDVDQICAQIKADSLSFLSVEGLKQGIGRDSSQPECGQCLACFTGHYPTAIYPSTVPPYEKQ